MFSFLSIRSKILAMLLFCGLGCLVVASYVSLRSGINTLKATIFEQLTTLRTAKTQQVTAWFKDVSEDFSDISQDTPSMAGVQAFTAAFAQLGQGAPATASPALDAYYRDKFLPTFASLVDAPLVPRGFLPASPAGLALQDAYVRRNPDPVGTGGVKETGVTSGPGGTASAYDAAVAQFQPFFRRAVETHALEDMLLVDVATGNVVYTVAKRTDLGANLLTGHLSSSGAARAFRRVLEGGGVPGHTVLEDYSSYVPAGLRPTAFVAAPVFADGTLVGVLIGVLSSAQVNSLMTNDRHWVEAGLGRTGEVYLVGAGDLLMRSPSRFQIEDPEAYYKALTNTGVSAETIARIKHFNSAVLFQRISTTGARDGQHGQANTMIVTDYRGVQTLASWAPVAVHGLHWVVVAQQDEAEAMVPVSDLQGSIRLVAALAAVLLTGVSVVLASVFTRPIRAVLRGVNELAAGDESVRIPVKGRDEFSDLARAFNAMAGEIAERSARIEQKTAAYEQLLRNFYPDLIADRIRMGEESFSERVRNVCMVVLVIDGFESLVGGASGDTLTRIDAVVSEIDEACTSAGLEKIRTIGETYIAACGLSTPRLDAAQRSLAFVQQVSATLDRLSRLYDLPLDVRAGLALGDAEIGIVGRHRMLYDVWGLTMLEARRIVFEAEPGSMRVTAAVRQQLGDPEGFARMPDIQLFDETHVETWQAPVGAQPAA
ncbi:adenylate/guanylate cyclase domain-containing protein [Azorhizobium oxalatiphilum]|uniref:Adenylate/guanylate cyclase domain-containing protein n=1 Tax=Azorhizobium oxalatiphilum TaxID=980631 RepID=A0A917CJI7_9HYPH|nr:adenylate/guanylate cyclase domain-containing protein [Azorhizobium oxalatiphilum]GGF88444.1 adenylate/guanylate cyclase domain-containing protein [Azorhizobium oxalatiphilum]